MWLFRRRLRRSFSGSRAELPGLVFLIACVLLSGCFSVRTEHKVEPIHITMDVNVRLEKELEETFSGLDARARELAEKEREEGEK